MSRWTQRPKEVQLAPGGRNPEIGSHDLELEVADKVHRLADNYSLQLNTYAYCLEHPAEGAFTVKPVKRLGILAFIPDRFAVRHADLAGIAGSLQWVDVEKDNGVIGKALGDVLPVLRQETPPESGEHCDWCAWFKRRQMSEMWG